MVEIDLAIMGLYVTDAQQVGFRKSLRSGRREDEHRLSGVTDSLIERELRRR
jgi:hypothetical protein